MRPVKRVRVFYAWGYGFFKHYTMAPIRTGVSERIDALHESVQALIMRQLPRNVLNTARLSALVADPAGLADLGERDVRSFIRRLLAQPPKSPYRLFKDADEWVATKVESACKLVTDRNLAAARNEQRRYATRYLRHKYGHLRSEGLTNRERARATAFWTKLKAGTARQQPYVARIEEQLRVALDLHLEAQNTQPCTHA